MIVCEFSLTDGYGNYAYDKQVKANVYPKSILKGMELRHSTPNSGIHHRNRPVYSTQLLFRQIPPKESSEFRPQFSVLDSQSLPENLQWQQRLINSKPVQMNPEILTHHEIGI